MALLQRHLLKKSIGAHCTSTAVCVPPFSIIRQVSCRHQEERHHRSVAALVITILLAKCDAGGAAKAASGAHLLSQWEADCLCFGPEQERKVPRSVFLSSGLREEIVVEIGTETVIAIATVTATVTGKEACVATMFARRWLWHVCLLQRFNQSAWPSV